MSTPMSSSQRRPNAAARLAALPLVALVQTRLSVVCSHPSLRSVCEGLESGVIALLSPVVGKLEPHMSVANEVACQSLDWLESAFPVLYTPTEQLVSTAKKTMAEIQDVVSIAVNGSADCVSVGLAWLMVRLEGAQDRGQPLVDRAIAAVAVGLETALTASEALVDRVLPPTANDTDTNVTVLPLEVSLQRSYLERLCALATKFYRRTFCMNCRFTLIQTILKLPEYLQYQLVSTVFVLQTQSCPTNKCQRFRVPSCRRPPEIHYMDAPATPPTCRLRKPTFGNVCSAKACVDR